jgi:hypothetical protein
MSDWRRTREYRSWRAAVIMRDKRCVICNSMKNRHAHHVNHASFFKEQRFEVDNGVTLCSVCHQNYHCNFHRSYRTKCDEYNFMNFVKLSTHFHGLWMKPYDAVAGGIPSMDAYQDQMYYIAAAFDRSPDSVVGYVTELATLRYQA